MSPQMKKKTPSTVTVSASPPGMDLDPLEPETWESAHRTYADLRARCPVAHSNRWDGFWALTKYEDIVSVTQNSRTFVTSVQNVVPRVPYTGKRPPLHVDPPEHTDYRRPMDALFRKSRLAMLEPAFRRMAVELLDPLIRTGSCDIGKDYAQVFPVSAFAHFLGVPVEEMVKIRAAGAIYTEAIQTQDASLVKEQSQYLYQVARELVADRKAFPRDPAGDITTALLAARPRGEPLPEDMVVGTLRQLIVASMGAMSVVIGSQIVHLAKNPPLQSLLRQDPARIPAAIEELLRLYPPYRGFARTPTRDVTLGGRTIRKGEPIALLFPSGNRDSAVFERPDECDIDRKPNKHLAFGRGAHKCVAAAMARLELRITLEELLSRTSGFELAGEIQMASWLEFGPRSVPLRMVPTATDSQPRRAKKSHPKVA